MNVALGAVSVWMVVLVPRTRDWRERREVDLTTGGVLHKRGCDWLTRGCRIHRAGQPHIAGRGHHAAIENIGPEVAGLGARAGLQCPTGAIPVQHQGRLLAGAVRGKVRPERPDIGRRNRGTPMQLVALELAVGSHVRAGDDTPGGAVVVLDQGFGGDIKLARRRLIAGGRGAHGPHIIGRQRGHSPQDVYTGADVGRMASFQLVPS